MRYRDLLTWEEIKSIDWCKICYICGNPKENTSSHKPCKSCEHKNHD